MGSVSCRGKNPVFFIALIVLALALCAGFFSSAAAETGFGEEKFKVGDKAPDFALPNVRGESVSLADVLAKGPAVVTFYRGHW